MRIILMCGKGGVGKSTLAASLGARAAECGQRTLVYSVDPAHSLAWAFGQAVGHEPTPVAAKLWAAELEAVAVLDEQWSEVRGYVESVMRSQGVERAAQVKLGGLPGVHEFASLVKLQQHATSGQFDAIVVDHAPTAFALRLLALPDTVGWYAKHGKKLWERYGAQALMALPMLGATIPMPNTQLVSRALELVDQLRELPGLLSDPARTSVRLVLGPDELSLAEARDLYARLSLYGLTTDQVLLNRVLPDGAGGEFFAPRRARELVVQSKTVASFQPLEVVSVPARPDEPQGLEALTELGRTVWPGADPTARHTEDLALRISRADDTFQVDIKLPFVAAKDVDLAKFENELYITVGRHKRNLVLPIEATDMQPVKAKFAEGRLLVTLARQQ